MIGSVCPADEEFSRPDRGSVDERSIVLPGRLHAQRHAHRPVISMAFATFNEITTFGKADTIG
jgi:hypothetical protein